MEHYGDDNAFIYFPEKLNGLSVALKIFEWPDFLINDITKVFVTLQCNMRAEGQSAMSQSDTRSVFAK